MARCKTADSCLGAWLESKDGINTAFDRLDDQRVKCNYGVLGVCCRLCSNGPCRITPESPRGVCGADADAIVARNFLRADFQG
jgi:carbon-monoxide dehydrogenase catalytic subunit